MAIGFLAGFVLGSCTPVPIVPKAPVVKLEDGDSMPMFTTRIRMCQPIIHEMPNWTQQDPDDRKKIDRRALMLTPKSAGGSEQPRAGRPGL